MPNIMTIRKAVETAKNEGYPVTDYTLRRWIKTGKIPARMIGSKALIFYPNLINFLQCTEGSDNKPAAPAGVRPVQ